MKTIITAFTGTAIGVITTLLLIGTIEIYTPEDILYLDMFGNIKGEASKDVKYTSFADMREKVMEISCKHTLTTDYQLHHLATNAAIAVSDGDVYLTLTNEYTNTNFTLEMNSIDELQDEIIYYFTD